MIRTVYEHCDLHIQGERPVEVVALRYVPDGEYTDAPNRCPHPTAPDTARIREVIRSRYGWAVTLSPWVLTARGWVARVVSFWTAGG